MAAMMTKADLLRVAAASGVDPRTVLRALAGVTRSPATVVAVCRGLRECGFAPEAERVESGRPQSDDDW